MVKKILKRYFIDAMGAMAQGLFASLLIGTIFKALGMIPKLEFLVEMGDYAQKMAGPAMAAAIVVYLVMTVLLGTVTKEDMKLIPGGGKLAKLLHLH